MSPDDTLTGTLVPSTVAVAVPLIFALPAADPAEVVAGPMTFQAPPSVPMFVVRPLMAESHMA
jgi:hypothetical protein